MTFKILRFKKKNHLKIHSVFKEGREFVCRTIADRQKGLAFYTDNSEIFSCIICKCIISTEYHTYVSCYEFKTNQRHQVINAWRRTFLRACYIHFRISGSKLEGRNCFHDAGQGVGEEVQPGVEGGHTQGQETLPTLSSKQTRNFMKFFDPDGNSSNINKQAFTLLEDLDQIAGISSTIILIPSYQDLLCFNTGDFLYIQLHYTLLH